MSNSLGSKFTNLYIVASLLITQCDVQLMPHYLEVYPPVDIGMDQENCFPNSSLNSTCPLFISFIVSMGGSFVTTRVIPGVQVALDQINADRSILPGYTLHYTLQDSKCNRTQALYALHTEMLQKPTKIASIGAGCSVATEATAEISYFYNITQISCTSSSPILSDRVRFQRYFQLLAIQTELAYAFLGMMKVFGWRKVSIILQEERLFTDNMNLLKQLMTESGIDYSEMRFRSEDGISDLIAGNNVFEENARIYILSMYQTHARNVLCEASKAGYKYPGYYFITYGWYPDKWWEGEAALFDVDTCTLKDRESVLLSTIAIGKDEFLSEESLSLNYSAVIDNGLVASQYLSLYDKKLSMSQFNITRTRSTHDQHCYDATWAIARALNKTAQDINSKNSTSLVNELLQFNSNLNLSGDQHFGLQHFTYNNSKLMESVFRHLEESNFVGVTGRVKFSKSTGVRGINFSVILQYQNTDDGGIMRNTIGHVNHTEKSSPRYVPLKGKNISDLFTDGLPEDGVANEVLVTVNIGLSVVFCVLAMLGIILTIVCVLFNFLFRKRRLIKLSSADLNFLIAIGGLVLYINIIFFVIPTTEKTLNTVLCNLTPWLTSIGYSLCYGTIILKMGRVYYIFNNPKLKKKKIKDWMLALGVLLLIAIDLVILITYTTVEGVQMKLGVNKVVNEENREDTAGVFKTKIMYVTYICIASKGRNIFLGILYGYKAVLQIVALIFAFSIRKVRVKGLDDTLYIGPAVYVTSIATAVILVSTYTLGGYVNGFAALWCTGLFVGTTCILLLVFIPKMHEVYKDPEGDTVFEDTVTGPIKMTTETSVYQKEIDQSLKMGELTLERMKPSNTENKRESSNLQLPSESMESKNNSEKGKGTNSSLGISTSSMAQNKKTQRQRASLGAEVKSE